MVAQESLELFVMVRIHAGQPPLLSTAITPQLNAAGSALGPSILGRRGPALIRLALILSCCAGAELAAIGKEPVLRTAANRMVEVTLRANGATCQPVFSHASVSAGTHPQRAHQQKANRGEHTENAN